VTARTVPRRAPLLLALAAVACGGDDAAMLDAADAGPRPGILAPTEPFRALEPPPAAPRPAGDAGVGVRIAYAHVAVAIDHDVARTVVTEVLVNDLDAAAEATFRFPLPDDAAVVDLVDVVDGVRHRAAIGGKAAARKAFDEAAARGERAALVETDGPTFELALAAIPPRGRRRVELTYVQTLQPLAGERTYAFPARRLAAQSPTHLDLAIEIVGARALEGLRALGPDDVRVTALAPDRATAHLARSLAGLDRDLAVRWREPGEAIALDARAVRTAAGEPGWVEVRFALDRDPWPAERPPRAVALVVDRSLSMAGEPLARAKAIARDVVLGLGAGDAVGLVGFAGDVDARTLAAATPAHRAALAGAIEAMTAGGPSDLAAALDEAAAMVAGRPGAVVVLLSDAQPTIGEGVDEALPATPAAELAGVRVVAGLFNYPSRQAALTALAPAATIHFVPDGDAGAEIGRQLVALAISASIDDLALTLDGALPGSVVGPIPTTLAVGDSIRVLARAAGPVTAHVRGRLRDRAVALDRTVAVPAAPDAAGDRGLPLAWARLRIADLDRRWVASPDDAVAAEIRALGTAHHLGTRFTSFVATDGLAPDRIMPGDPEIRVRAPRGADDVAAVLPWGERVELAWDEREALWLGRFLVPRATPDGLYRVRIFVTAQGRTSLRATLHYLVDSAAPTFDLAVVHAGGIARIVATPRAAVFDRGRDGDELRLDHLDLRRLTVRIGEVEVPLAYDDVHGDFRAEVSLALATGRHEAVLTAVDLAGNPSEARTTFAVAP
jgi:Mg-chelatase subunit ChlD